MSNDTHVDDDEATMALMIAAVQNADFELVDGIWRKGDPRGFEYGHFIAEAVAAADEDYAECNGVHVTKRDAHGHIVWSCSFVDMDTDALLRNFSAWAEDCT